MPSQVNIWGPEFSEYSRRECVNPRPSEVVSNTQVANFYNIYGVTPLATLERLLLKCDPRTDTLNASSSTPLNMVIDIIRRYLAVSKQKIFKNYYGFLLVYHLIYVTCLAILKETNTLDQLLESLHPDTSWSDVSRHVAFAAQDRVAEASQNAASLGEFYGKFAQRGLFAPYDSAPATDTVWLARIIWEDRDSFLTLCLRGHLPGCGLLLLLALEFLPPNLGQAKNGLLYLQDLGFRLYLVGSRRDQQNLQRVCVGAVDKNVGWPNTRNIFTSAEDSQTLARAYSGLLRVWRRDKSSTKLVPIRLMSFLSGFVLHMSELNRLATPQEHIDVMSTSFQFLWLVFEQRGRIPVADHSEMRHFATLVFFGLQFLEKTRVLTQAERQRLGKMLTDVEAIGLAGRVVLLLADEGNDFQNTELVDQALEDLSELKAILDPSVSIAADPFRDMRAEWVTVANHLASLAGGGMLNRKDKDKDPIRCWLGMWDTWVQFGKLLGNGDDTPHSCAYPRCWRPPTPWKDVKTDYKCGRCTMVSYCGPDCQRAHWQLATSESHRLQCNPSGLPLAE